MYASRHITTVLFFLVLFAAFIGSLIFFTQQVPLVMKQPQQPEAGRLPEKEPAPAYYNRAGEQISYSVNMGKLTIGSAVFSCLPNTVENGRILSHMIFETKLKGFQDKETIYSDALTLMPVRVTRDVQNLLKREYITEHYDHQNFTLTIIKKNGQKEGVGTIFKKDSPIHNAVLLPHYVRILPELKVGQSFPANLAKRAYEIKLVSLEDIKVPAGEYKTYHFESVPRQIEIWLSADKDRIPVRVLGLGAFSYSLDMVSYTPPQNLSQNTPKSPN